jgi:AcrR family transcriptional regulator
MIARSTRAEVTSANRSAVLRCARREFERSGYHGAVLARIAEEAGFSEGVVYSQFGSKADLFLAVLEASIDDRAAVLMEAARGASGIDELRRIALDQSVASLAWQATLIEFRVHAWRDPDLNDRYRALHARTVENVVQAMSVMLPDRRDGIGRVAFAVLAASAGVTLEVMADSSVDAAGVLDDLILIASVETRGPRT